MWVVEGCGDRCDGGAFTRSDEGSGERDVMMDGWVVGVMIDAMVVLSSGMMREEEGDVMTDGW